MMPPKSRTAKPRATAKRTATTSPELPIKKAAAKKTEETVTKPAEKPATNGASKKRKADEDMEPEDDVEAPKAKKSRTIAKPKAAAKPAAKAAPKAPAKKAAAKPAKAPAKKAKAAAKPVKEPSPAPEEEEESEDEKEEEEEEAKVEEVKEKPKPAPKKAAGRPPKIAIAKKSATPHETGKKINDAPTQILDVYVFGEGTSGELGLGSRRVNKKKPIDVKRPRLNDNLSAANVGVVQVACGGMHVAALTHDNKILTWGVNDQGALGRDTTWDGGLRDMDEDESEDEDDTGMNPKESTPTAVSDEHFLPGTKFVQVVASDSATFALTETGKVYGWGTFRSSDGILGFSETIRVQNTPLLVPGLKNIKSLAAGANHILALDHKGHVVAWGCGQQNQLGRRIIERNKMSSLIPQGVGLPRGKIAKIACGSYHSFAIDKDGTAWGWGLNNFGEIGVESNAGEDDAVILKPAKITYLEDETIIDIDGGGHHSLACTDKGELYTWGRVDGYQVGFEFEDLDKENVIFDERGAPRILFKPTLQEDVPNTISVAAGTDNNFAVTKEGKAYSWGFSSNYQTGQGTIDDIKVPTHIDNTAIRGKQIVQAGAGGQYSILVGIASEVNGVQTNGVNGDKN